MEVSFVGACSSFNMHPPCVHQHAVCVRLGAESRDQKNAAV